MRRWEEKTFQCSSSQLPERLERSFRNPLYWFTRRWNKVFNYFFSRLIPQISVFVIFVSWVPYYRSRLHFTNEHLCINNIHSARRGELD
jgi:hypothetical protein